MSEESKAYKLFDPISKKIVVSRYVVFDEQGEWDCSKKGKWDKGEATDLCDREDTSDSESDVGGTKTPGATFNELNSERNSEFGMSDLGNMSYFLGVEVVQSEKGIFINQDKYAKDVLEKFGMSDSKPVNNPIVLGSKLTKLGSGAKVDATKYKQMVGNLMYLTPTRPDLILVSRFMEAPTEEHLQAVKRILRYLKGTKTLDGRKGSGEILC